MTIANVIITKGTKGSLARALVAVDTAMNLAPAKAFSDAGERMPTGRRLSKILMLPASRTIITGSGNLGIQHYALQFLAQRESTFDEMVSLLPQAAAEGWAAVRAHLARAGSPDLGPDLNNLVLLGWSDAAAAPAAVNFPLLNGRPMYATPQTLAPYALHPAMPDEQFDFETDALDKLVGLAQRQVQWGRAHSRWNFEGSLIVAELTRDALTIREFPLG